MGCGKGRGGVAGGSVGGSSPRAALCAGSGRSPGSRERALFVCTASRRKPQYKNQFCNYLDFSDDGSTPN